MSNELTNVLLMTIWFQLLSITYILRKKKNEQE
jgi:hypothetical protein